jgi:hypothetical protein
MKVKDLTFKVGALKPRDPNHAILAAKKNAGGAMRDKKQELKRGEFKHRGRAFEDQEEPVLTRNVMTKVQDLLSTEKVRATSISDRVLDVAREIKHDFVSAGIGRWLISVFKHADRVFAAVYPPDQSGAKFFEPVVQESLHEGYEKTVLNVLKDAGISGWFESGVLYVQNERDAKAAADALKDSEDITRAPKILVSEALTESAGSEMKRHAMLLKREGNVKGYHRQMIKYLEHMIGAAEFNARHSSSAAKEIKKLEAELLKHRQVLMQESLIIEASLGSRVSVDTYAAWKKSIPPTSSIDGDPRGLEVARCVAKDFEGVCGKFDHKKNEGWVYKYYLNPKNLVVEGRRHVYGPGDEILVNHPNKHMKALGDGKEVKVMTRNGVAKLEKVQFFNGGSAFKLDREIKLSDGSKSAWVPDNEVSFDLSKGAPDAKAYARKYAAEEQLSEKWHDSGAADAEGRWAKYAKGQISAEAMADWLIRSRVHKKTREEKIKSALGAISQQQNTSKLISAEQADALRKKLKPKDSK